MEKTPTGRKSRSFHRAKRYKRTYDSSTDKWSLHWAEGSFDKRKSQDTGSTTSQCFKCQKWCAADHFHRDCSHFQSVEWFRAIFFYNRINLVCTRRRRRSIRFLLDKMWMNLSFSPHRKKVRRNARCHKKNSTLWNSKFDQRSTDAVSTRKYGGGFGDDGTYWGSKNAASKVNLSSKKCQEKTSWVNFKYISLNVGTTLQIVLIVLLWYFK